MITLAKKLGSSRLYSKRQNEIEDARKQDGTRNLSGRNTPNQCPIPGDYDEDDDDDDKLVIRTTTD